MSQLLSVADILFNLLSTNMFQFETQLYCSGWISIAYISINEEINIAPVLSGYHRYIDTGRDSQRAVSDILQNDNSAARIPPVTPTLFGPSTYFPVYYVRSTGSQKDIAKRVQSIRATILPAIRARHMDRGSVEAVSIYTNTGIGVNGDMWDFDICPFEL